MLNVIPKAESFFHIKEMIMDWDSRSSMTSLINITEKHTAPISIFYTVNILF